MFESILLSLLEKQLQYLSNFLSFDKNRECLDAVQFILWYKRTHFASHFDVTNKRSVHLKRHQLRSVIRRINYLLKKHKIEENKSFDVNCQIVFNINSVYFNSENCEFVEIKKIFTVHKFLQRFIKLQDIHEKIKRNQLRNKHNMEIQLEFSKLSIDISSLIDDQRCISLL